MNQIIDRQKQEYPDQHQYPPGRLNPDNDPDPSEDDRKDPEKEDDGNKRGYSLSNGAHVTDSLCSSGFCDYDYVRRWCIPGFD